MPASATCSQVFLAILFFIELFHIRILLFCCCLLSIYVCASSSIDQAERLHETSWLGQPSPLAFQNESARFQLTSCDSETISTELTTDCRVGFKMMHNSVLSYKRASSPRVITPLRNPSCVVAKEKRKKSNSNVSLLSLYLTLYNLMSNLMRFPSEKCLVVKCFTIVSSENLSYSVESGGKLSVRNWQKVSENISAEIFFCRNYWVLISGI